MVERQLPKLDTRVRFPSPALNERTPGTLFAGGLSFTGEVSRESGGGLDASEASRAPTDPASGSEREDPRTVGRRIVSGLLSYGVVVLAVWYLRHEPAERRLDLRRRAHHRGRCCSPRSCSAWSTSPPTGRRSSSPCPGCGCARPRSRTRPGPRCRTPCPRAAPSRPALNYAMLRSWGFTLGDTTSEVLVTGTWSQLTKYILLALGLVAGGAPGLGPGLGGVGRPRARRARGRRGRAARPASCAARRFAGPARRLVRPASSRASGAGSTRIPDPGLTEGLPLFRTQMVRLLRLCWGRLTATMVSRSSPSCSCSASACGCRAWTSRHLVGRDPRGLGAGHLRVAAHPHPGRSRRGRGGARRGARPRAARVRPAGGAGRRAALPRSRPSSCRSRSAWSPTLLAEVHRRGAGRSTPAGRAPAPALDGRTGSDLTLAALVARPGDERPRRVSPGRASRAR